jgi:uncharacterized protein YjbJ (UPF0337 family)
LVSLPRGVTSSPAFKQHLQQVQAILTLPSISRVVRLVSSHCFCSIKRSGTTVAEVDTQRTCDCITERTMMNWDRVEGNWKQMTGKVKEQWGRLTDDALAEIGGRREQLVGKIQETYGISRDEADRQVKDWEKTH